MLKVFALAALLLTTLLLPAAHAEEEKTPLALRDFSEVKSLFYQNPQLTGVADPFIFSADGVYYMVAKLFATGVVTVWNYVMKRRAIRG